MHLSNIIRNSVIRKPAVYVCVYVYNHISKNLPFSSLCSNMLPNLEIKIGYKKF